VALLRQLARGLRALTKPSAADEAVADEVQHYLDEATAAHAARGLSTDDARRAARLELGGAVQIREQIRTSGWEHIVTTVLADLRYAARGLRGAPGFTAIAVLTLAVGVGATTAIWSAVNPILFVPPPYPDPHRIVMIWERPHRPQTFATYRELADRARSFEAIAVVRPWQPTMIGTAEPERLEGQRVSARYFEVLGVSPLLGRSFEPADDQLGGPNVVVLSDAIWRRHFAADPAIVGRQLRLDDNLYQVIGVMPPAFENVLAPAAAVWAPLQYDMSEGRAWGHHLHAVGRLRRGVNVAHGAEEVDTIGRDVAVRHPEAYGRGATSVIVPLHDDLTRAVKPALLALLGAAVLVLAIACVNVTNLLLARGVRRRGEFGLRVALGAGRMRLTGQLLVESLLLAAIGGAVGMAIATLGVSALAALSPPGLQRASAIAVDGAVLAFGVGVTTIIGVCFGLIPALQAARSDPQADLRHGSRRSGGGHRRIRAALVVVEVALALVLLVSSGLLLRSLQRLFAVESGFDSSQLLTMQVQTSGRRFDDDAATNRFFTQVIDAVRRVPGVTAAAATSQLPLSGDLDQYGVHFDATPARSAESYNTFRYAVSPGYLETMRVPLRAGRFLNEQDRAGTARVAMISESLGRRRFGGESPIGQQLRIGPKDGPPYTIVGVVGNVKQLSLALAESDAVYTTSGQWRFADSAMSLVVRTRADAAPLARAVREAVWSVDKDQPVVRIATMDELMAISAAERRFALILFEAFAVAALVLAGAGIYGMLAGSVAERTREIGVRAALGATRINILELVIRETMTLTALGVVIGLAGASLASRAIAALLFGVSHLDPVTYVSVAGLVAVVSAIAAGMPAWRATRVDPASTLRAE